MALGVTVIATDGLSLQLTTPMRELDHLSKDRSLHVRIFGDGKPHWEQRCFWTWKDDRPQRTHRVCDLLWRLPNDEVPFVYTARGG